ncbi:MAG TPA: STAS domain-containing protein [Streptomyces sp.]|nr:STAS domain-containing protein [Streptomyces sp.]
MDLRMMTRRCGPTVHLTPIGELDVDTRGALDEVQTAVEGVDVVACDMRRLTFLDVSGLHGLIAFVRRLDQRGVAFFAYNWQPEPLRLLDLVDDLAVPIGRAGDRGTPTELLRQSLRGSAAAHRAAGAAQAQAALDETAAVRRRSPR